MFPFLRPGDRLIVRRGASLSPGIGDIVLFHPEQARGPRTLTAHRIVSRSGRGRFITKGDNLSLPDPGSRVTDDIEGIAVMLFRKGRPLSLITGPRGWAGKWVAWCSRNNLTPGILLARAGKLPEIFT